MHPTPAGSAGTPHTETTDPRPWTVDDLPDHLLDAAARAAQFYAGSHSALYALASTGSLELYPGEGLGRLARELEASLPAARVNVNAARRECEFEEFDGAHLETLQRLEDDVDEALADLQALEDLLAWARGQVAR